MHCVEHWAQKIPNKHRPKVCSKHVGTLWETIKGIFWIWKFFDFFESFRRLDPPWNSGKKLFFPKKSPKTRLDTWERFGQFENFEIFSIFFWNLFYVSTSNFKSGKPNSNFLSPENWPHIFKSRKSEKPCMEHSAKKTRKNCLKACSKQVWTLLKTTSVIFGILKIFWFFLKFFKTRPSMEHGAIFLSEKKPQNLFKTSLDNFGNNSVLFRTFEFSLIFLRKLSMTPWNTGQKKISKKLPQNTFGHLGTILDKF